MSKKNHLLRGEKLPPAKLPKLGAPSQPDIDFATTMRSWRQVSHEEEKEKLWQRLCDLASGAHGRIPNPFIHSSYRPSALHEAVTSGSFEALDLIAKTGGPMLSERINEPDIDGMSKRFGPEASGKTVITHCWLASTNTDGTDRTSAAMIRRLIELGAHPDGCAAQPGAPIIMSAAMGDLEAVRALLDAGARIDRRVPISANGTILHYALKRREPAMKMHDLLVERGIDVEALDDDGRSAYDTASEEQCDWIRARKEKLILEKASGAASEPGRPSLRV